jgi:hypothetical protein
MIGFCGLVPVPALAQQSIPSTASAAPSAAGGVELERTPEDFTNLGLATSDLQPQPPIPGGHEQNADFTRDLVRLQWRIGDPIDVYIVLPTAVKHPPVALYLLNYPNGSERFLNSQFCRRLTQNGVAAVGFSTALTAERYVRRPMKQWFISQLQESMAASAHDVQLVLDYLASRGDLDTSRVGIFGQGSGAAVAILAASVDSRIQALDLMEPWGDWPDFLAGSDVIPEDERPGYLKPDFLHQLDSVEPARFLPVLKSRSIRMQFVDQEPALKWYAKISNAAPSGTEIHHYASSEELRIMTGQKLFQWLPERLKAEERASGWPEGVQTAAPPAAMQEQKGATP